MQLFALGLNHHTAPLAIREQVAFRPERLAQALADFVQAKPVKEAAILSTCNRTELYFATQQPRTRPTGSRNITGWHCRICRPICTPCPSAMPCATCSGWPAGSIPW
jgi:glutamyl-tRNA reductase